MMLQNWSKQGLIFPPSLAQGASHLAVPVVWPMGDVLRVFYSSRTIDGKSQPYFLDYSLLENQIIKHSKGAILPIGKVGTFDADGVMPTTIIAHDRQYHMYYIGWNIGVDVPFRNSIGMATSRDLTHWTKAFEGPVLDRAPGRPYFTASSEVVAHKGQYFMYFLNCIGWDKIGKGYQHRYHIQLARSGDGVNWTDRGEVAIGFASKHEYAISRPCVIKEKEHWHMWYSYRGSKEIVGYRIGYATSADGVKWHRRDDAIALHTGTEAWEEAMQCYPCVFMHQKKYYMLYNGNGFGKTGIGMAVLETDRL